MTKCIHCDATVLSTSQPDDSLLRCAHGNCLRDGSGELLEPPCGCRAALAATETWTLSPASVALTEAIMDDDLKKAIAAAKPAPCGIHCTVCEGMDHHWMPDCDDETGDPVMVCKHCDATTEYFDEDEDEDDAAPDKETFK